MAPGTGGWEGVCVCVRSPVCACVDGCACVCIGMYVCVHVCVYVRRYVCFCGPSLWLTLSQCEVFHLTLFCM
jgi:hypothetical protein